MKDTMKTLVVDAGHALHIKEVPLPKYNRCQALVKMESCGICNGTDLKIIHGTFKNFHNYPAILGHEGVGRVVEVGDQVRSFKPGDLVLLPFIDEPLDGNYSGFGSFSEYAIIGDLQAYLAEGWGPPSPEFREAYYAQTLIKPSDKVNPVEASMIVTFREVLSAMRRFQFNPNESLLVMGAGPVGLCFTKFAKLLGLGTVICTDIDDEKTALASSMGADYAFNPLKTNLGGELKKLFPQGIDKVVDAVGINDLINQAMELINYNGKICCYGISPELGMNLDWSRAPYNWTIQFVQWPLKIEEYEAHAQVMAWINQGVLEPAQFISHVFDFKDIIQAFALVEEKKPGTKKVVISYS
ncbi:MAG: zinc-binding dehydrogenase [Treponema sp.]|nr:zinc-binding dehydrogenase [Treponema sp.]